MRLRYRALMIALLLACLTLVSFATRAQNSSRNDPQLEVLDQKLKDFLRAIVDDDVHTAYQDLLSGSPLARQTDAVANLELKTKELETKYGAFRSVEQISAKRVGADLVLMKYLFNCENFPVVWYFTYYRMYKRGEAPRDNWAVVAMRFDTDVELLDLKD